MENGAAIRAAPWQCGLWGKEVMELGRQGSNPHGPCGQASLLLQELPVGKSLPTHYPLLPEVPVCSQTHSESCCPAMAGIVGTGSGQGGVTTALGVKAISRCLAREAEQPPHSPPPPHQAAPSTAVASGSCWRGSGLLRFRFAQNQTCPTDLRA